MEKIRILTEGGSGEIEEKKSRFIAHIASTESEEEAVAFIEGIKKKYWDARHNCSAMVIGKKGELTRCSDDGEPSGTAGRPMLEVLLQEGLHNVTVVVTRYFGGTLLGTGGLVRAYTQAVKEGLAHCKTGVLTPGMELTITTDYNGIGKILHYIESNKIRMLRSDYTDTVRVGILIPLDKKDAVIKEITEMTNGRAGLEEICETTFIDNET